MKEFPRLKVEENFNEFVREIGGELVQNLIPKMHNLPRNADYFFASDCVIAELKCLEKDLFQDEKYRKKLDRMYERWVLGGLIRPLTSATDTVRLPEECSQEMLRLARRTIEDRIRSADNQIKETKASLDKPQAKGLLLLANDGNYSFESSAIRYLAGQILLARGEGSSIDGFVYFTVNMQATIPGSEKNWTVWAPAYRTATGNENLMEFVDRIGSQWASFYAKKLGENVKGALPIYDDVEEIFDQMKFVKRS